MDVSFIVLNYNTPELTLQCVRSISQQVKGVEYEIIVVDNASEEYVVKQLKDSAAFYLYCHERNEGFAKGNNIGASLAKGEYLFFLNSDTYLLNDAATILFKFMNEHKHEKIGVCGGDLFDEKENRQVSYGNFPRLLQVIGDVGLKRLFPNYYDHHLTLSKTNEDHLVKKVDYLSGADWFIDRSLFLKMGGFDTDFFLYFEETELAYRLHKKGYSSVLVPKARIVHLEGASSKENGFQERRFVNFEKSRFIYFRKCYGLPFAYLIRIWMSIYLIGLWLFCKDKLGRRKCTLIWSF